MHIVILIDVSGSIEPESMSDAFDAIENLSTHLNRGDRITIIPIMSDAFTLSSGHILRFEVPEKREAYDADLKQFFTSARSSLSLLRSQTLSHRGKTTDILGAIEVAQQEVFFDNDKMRKEMKILSDFIEEDSQFNFRIDSRLEDTSHASILASQMAPPNHNELFASVYLGFLRSKSLPSMNPKRKAAIVTFWRAYCRTLGNTIWVNDGPGHLPENH